MARKVGVQPRQEGLEAAVVVPSRPPGRAGHAGTGGGVDSRDRRDNPHRILV